MPFSRVKRMDSKKIIIEYTPKTCIGAGECVKNDPTLFGFNDATRKAILIGGKPADGKVVGEAIGSEERIKYALTAASSCPVNAFVVKDAHTQKILVGNTVHHEKLQEISAEYDDMKEFVLDSKGYFLFRVNYEKKEIEAGFCNSKNNLVLKVTGKTPIAIYHAIAAKATLGLRPEHYAYLGRELEKAHYCLVKNLQYVQDDPLESMKPRGK
jgi:ferredoxin